jgi:hypothetical protein
MGITPKFGFKTPLYFNQTLASLETLAKEVKHSPELKDLDSEIRRIHIHMLKKIVGDIEDENEEIQLVSIIKGEGERNGVKRGWIVLDIL